MKSENQNDESTPLSKGITQLIQTKDGQGKPVSDSLNGKINSSKGKGSYLDKKTQSFMSEKFGVDFSLVKIHADDEAAGMNKEINAKAFTVGNNIYFNKGEYNPFTQEGKNLLAHELTHTLQQGSSMELGAVQRDDGADAKEAEDARLNFEDDWKNFFSNYGDILKDAVITYDKNLDRNIKAVKTGKKYTITLGKNFYTEAEEQVRIKWIKAAIVDQFIKVDKFEEIAYDPTHAKLNELNPQTAGKCVQNCPAAAGALDEYLRTGKITPAFCDPGKEGQPGFGFDTTSGNTYSKKRYPDWKSAEAQLKKQLKKHGSFAVVEGERTPEQKKQEHIAGNHYFIVMNVRGTLFVADAYGSGKATSAMEDYATNLKVSTYRIAIGKFTAITVVPKK
jgi:hypothetical protein